MISASSLIHPMSFLVGASPTKRSARSSARTPNATCACFEALGPRTAVQSTAASRMISSSVTATAPTAVDLSLRYHIEGLWGRPQHLGAIESWAARDPDRLAVVDPYGSFTYAELDDSTCRARSWLEDRGVVAGEAVVGVLPNWFESVAFYHAVLRLGAVAV